MALTGNIAGLSIADADLLAYVPQLGVALPAGQADWSAQRDAGKKHALHHAYSSTGKDPEWTKAAVDDHWKRVLVASTLFVIYDGMGPIEPWSDLAEKWEKRFLDWFSRVHLEHDEDRDGVISETSAEAASPSSRNWRRSRTTPVTAEPEPRT